MLVSVATTHLWAMLEWVGLFLHVVGCRLWEPGSIQTRVVFFLGSAYMSCCVLWKSLLLKRQFQKYPVVIIKRCKRMGKICCNVSLMPEEGRAVQLKFTWLLCRLELILEKHFMYLRPSFASIWVFGVSVQLSFFSRVLFIFTASPKAPLSLFQLLC